MPLPRPRVVTHRRTAQTRVSDPAGGIAVLCRNLCAREVGASLGNCQSPNLAVEISSTSTSRSNRNTEQLP